MEVLSKAEQRASAATKLGAFPIQLPEVRRTVREILELFGRNNFFAEYTVHNFSHIEAMLADLEWIIPDEAKKKMSSADWLLLTLSIYFHDLGLVVTEEEFANRDISVFGEFCRSVLFSSNDGRDYKLKVETLGQERAERFFYQEFVRFHHARRVRSWIEGRESDELGYAKAQISQIQSLLSRVDDDFRKDLALICESHNLDDLEDLKKYKPFKPYGRDEQEAANLLYVSVLLRTTDLLQITRQRAPSVMFRMINPTDPISQAEWAKQNAVKRVCPRPPRDENGEVTNLQSDTISVYAKFDNENGFFGLTSYLAYAERQLAYGHDCVQKANSETINKLAFPWRKIDDSEVEAFGFIPSPFEFNIDQTKILDLLTGHTLYNDSSVALRELVQNSLDAVRLQCHSRGANSSEDGHVFVHWSTKDGTLVVRDNGTGMTQEIIEKHLLKVGSSQYQDSKFREQNPDFFPISRFGIGILSAFMVADHVQIATIHKDGEQGRSISLRSVHGKYLIKLLDGASSPDAKEIGAHGTKITLRMRPSAKKLDVIDTLKRWIVFPRCNINVQVDDGQPISIGYSSPKAAIEAYLEKAEPGLDLDSVEVHEISLGDSKLGFATTYSKHFRDRTFIQYSDSMKSSRDTLAPVGVCIEGIRVEFGSPGFSGVHGNGLLSIIDCCGADAPKTNVARSSLEAVEDRGKLSRTVLEAYLSQVQAEVKRLQSDEGFSLSYSVHQFPFIAAALFSAFFDDRLRTEVFSSVPMFMIESENSKQAASIRDMISWGGFWTIDSISMASLIRLTRDTPAHVTCKKVMEASELKNAPLPDGKLLISNWESDMKYFLESAFEICELRASVKDRRLDACWKPRSSDEASWIINQEVEADLLYEVKGDVSLLRQFRREARNKRRSNIPVLVPRSSFQVSGLDNYFAVRLGGAVRLLPETPLAEFLLNLQDKGGTNEKLRLVLFCDALEPYFTSPTESGESVRAEVDYLLREQVARFEKSFALDIVPFKEALDQTEGRLSVFNPWSWEREGSVA